MNEDLFVKHLTEKYKHPAFMDGVGEGSILGEIVACAVILPDQCRINEIDDSKKLNHETIDYLAPILKRCTIFSFGIVTTEELNELKNIHKADMLAMRRAVEGLPYKPDAVFVDGKYHVPGLTMPTYAVIKGDSKVYGIAVASILAKNHRDKMISEKYGETCSRYHVRSNHGYRSPDHLLSIRRWGITPFHRAWQRQIRQVLSGQYDEVIQRKYRKRWEELCRDE